MKCPRCQQENPLWHRLLERVVSEYGRLRHGGEARGARERGHRRRRAFMLTTLERSGWNHSRTAEALGIGRTTLWRKLKEYGIDK